MISVRATSTSLNSSAFAFVLLIVGACATSHLDAQIPRFGGGAEEAESGVDSKDIAAADLAVFDGLRSIERALAKSMVAYDTAKNDRDRERALDSARTAIRALQKLYERALDRGVVIAPDAKPTLAERYAALKADRELRESDVQEPVPGRIFVSAADHMR
ncbi:MAG: hypothetical protein AAF488_10850, partial [Planctomycetota bacterium]